MISKKLKKKLKELQRLEGKKQFANLAFDMPFKKTFGSEGEEEPLIAMLNVCLESELTYPITKVRILNPYIIGQTKRNRKAELDIRCKDSNGNEFIVEMQIGKQKHFVKRAAFYSSSTIVSSAPKDKDKQWDFNFPNVYSLNFLHFDLPVWKDSDDIIHPLSYVDKTMPELRFDFSNLVFVRLSKFNKTLTECDTLKDKLLFAIKHAHEFDEQPEELCGQLFDKIFQSAKIANFTFMEHAEYRSSLMRSWDEYARIKCAEEEGWETGLAKGMEKGMEKGMAKGMEKGLTKGMAKGVAIGEARGRNEILNLMAQGYDHKQIKEILKSR